MYKNMPNKLKKKIKSVASVGAKVVSTAGYIGLIVSGVGMVALTLTSLVGTEFTRSKQSEIETLIEKSFEDNKLNSEEYSILRHEFKQFREYGSFPEWHKLYLKLEDGFVKGSLRDGKIDTLERALLKELYQE